MQHSYPHCRRIAAELAPPLPAMVLQSAYSRVAPDATAFPWRKALYCFSYTQEFENAAGAPAALAAANRVQAALRPFLPGEVRCCWVLPLLGLLGAGLLLPWSHAWPQLQQLQQSAASDSCLLRHPVCVFLLQPAYINFLDDQVSADPMRSYYGGNAGWLRQLKRQFGPAGFFSTNVMAILPASGSQK